MTVLDWLLDSDPAIRWQVLRDLVHAPAEVVSAELVRHRLTAVAEHAGQRFFSGEVEPCVGGPDSCPGSASLQRELTRRNGAVQGSGLPRVSIESGSNIRPSTNGIAVSATGTPMLPYC